MTYQEKIQWLNGCRQALEEERFLEKELQALQTEAARLDGTAQPGGGPAWQDDTGARCRKRLALHKRKALDRRFRLVSAMTRLHNDRQREVLHKRYLEDKSFREIADEMGLVERYVYRLHRGAVEALEPEEEGREQVTERSGEGH